LRHFFATDPNIFYELAEDLQDFDVSNLDRIIDTPALILAGAKDNMVPLEECRWLAKRLPMAELEVMAHGSHCPHLDDPAYVNERIDRFLSTYKF
jgi:pimeloyl-ACP methyl ester carboxylesterase